MVDPSRIRLVSMIQDWSFTQSESLEDHESPQTRALDWILRSEISMIEWDCQNLLKEKFALATLFYATNGNESWVSTDGWMSSDSICSWYGITCNSRGAIRRLDLSQNGLASSIPPEVALLNLESLGLYSNELVGTIPKELYRMTDLGKRFAFSPVVLSLMRLAHRPINCAPSIPVPRQQSLVKEN